MFLHGSDQPALFTTMYASGCSVTEFLNLGVMLNVPWIAQLSSICNPRQRHNCWHFDMQISCFLESFDITQHRFSYVEEAKDLELAFTVN
jgi:hypothetical protein